ncbi:MAG: hypothetical protein GEU86_12925 [Actinophytocola sp.]|nr:hypothetical protein [Actinophytocola sp.]
MATTLQELGALHLSRPTAKASKTEIAAWYERKATVLEHLAAEGASQARAMAVTAHAHAARLLAAAGAVMPR